MNAITSRLTYRRLSLSILLRLLVSSPFWLSGLAKQLGVRSSAEGNVTLRGTRRRPQLFVATA
jgi:hypothetical protein